MNLELSWKWGQCGVGGGCASFAVAIALTVWPPRKRPSQLPRALLLWALDFFIQYNNTYIIPKFTLVLVSYCCANK